MAAQKRRDPSSLRPVPPDRPRWHWDADDLIDLDLSDEDCEND